MDRFTKLNINFSTYAPLKLGTLFIIFQKYGNSTVAICIVRVGGYCSYVNVLSLCLLLVSEKISAQHLIIYQLLPVGLSALWCNFESYI